MGSKSSPSAPVCSHSPDAVPIDSSVHQVLFKCRPPRLRWTTSSSATTTRVHDMAWLAGRPGGILPAIRSRLSATMSCNLLCPIRLSTSIFVTWSFHVMPNPQIFRKLRCWKTSSCWRILAVLFQVSLVYMAVETIRGVQRSSLILSLSELDRHTLSSRWKTAAAFANRVLISASTSPSLDITLPR